MRFLVPREETLPSTMPRSPAHTAIRPRARANSRSRPQQTTKARGPLLIGKASKMTSQIATHDAPAWRQMANFLIFADLSSSGMVDHWEQLWAQQLSADEFIVCCIPYFTYGLALGDTVRTSPQRGRHYVVETALKRSGRRVLRLWLKNAADGTRDSVVRSLERRALLHEWSSENLLAIDIAPSDAIGDLIATIESESIEYEWGDERQ